MKNIKYLIKFKIRFIFYFKETNYVIIDGNLLQNLLNSTQDSFKEIIENHYKLSRKNSYIISPNSPTTSPNDNNQLDDSSI